MIAHIIEVLLSEGITKATFIIGHLGDQIEAFVASNYPELRSTFITQKEMLGLGHAIYTAIPTFDEEKIFIILGDTIFDVDLKNVFKSKGSSLGVKEVEDPRRFGVAFMEGSYIKELIEKPKEPVSKLALVGLYYITNPALLKECLEEIVDKNIKTRGEYQLTDALQLMITKGEKIKTFNVEGWYDCGKPETLLATNKFLLSKNGTNREIINIVVNSPVYISPSAVVEDSVIGPFATIGDNCIIKNSIIKNSIIGSDSVVEKSLLENSIIGSNAIIKGSFQKLNAGDSSEIEFF